MSQPVIVQRISGESHSTPSHLPPSCLGAEQKTRNKWSQSKVFWICEREVLGDRSQATSFKRPWLPARLKLGDLRIPRAKASLSSSGTKKQSSSDGSLKLSQLCPYPLANGPQFLHCPECHILCTHLRRHSAPCLHCQLLCWWISLSTLSSHPLDCPRRFSTSSGLANLRLHFHNVPGLCRLPSPSSFLGPILQLATLSPTWIVTKDSSLSLLPASMEFGRECLLPRVLWLCQSKRQQCHDVLLCQSHCRRVLFCIGRICKC